MKYLVTWEIDSDAATPEEAAKEARAAQIRPGTTATVFDVIDSEGSKTRVDLMDLEEEESGTDANQRFADRMRSIWPWLAEKPLNEDGEIESEDVSGADTIDELQELYNSLTATPDEPAKPPRIVVVMEGGLITDILSDQPVEAVTIDYDTDGAHEDETRPIPQGAGREPADAHAGLYGVSVSPERAAELWYAALGVTNG